jgi:multicomponent Na+:H+ antiporter subunit E
MQKQFLLNLLLTFVWVSLTGNFLFSNFLFGFVLGYFILWTLNRNSDERGYFKRLPKVINFVFFFIYELILANLEVAYDLITPRYYMKPGIVKYELAARTDMEITLLSNLISLTPGTFIVDVSDDKKVLYIHAMYVKDKRRFIKRIREGFERRLLNILR